MKNKKILLLSIFCALIFSGCSLIPHSGDLTFKYKHEDGEWITIERGHVLETEFTNLGAPRVVGEEIRVGWDDGSGHVYKEGDTYKLKGDTVFTAVYKEACWLVVANSGLDQVIAKGDVFELIKENFEGDDVISPKFEKITGWTYVTLNGIEQYAPGDTITVKEHGVLIANFENYNFIYFVPSVNNKIVRDFSVCQGYEKTIDADWWDEYYFKYNYEFRNLEPTVNFEWEAFILDETTNEWVSKTSIGIDQSVSQELNDSVTSPYSLQKDDKIILIPFKYGNNPTFNKL